MHPVLENILARRNKKPPFNDGRKIALLHFGGALTGVRAAGVLSTLQELKLNKAFDEVYSLSAGFPNCSFFLGGDIDKGVKVYFKNLTTKQFINPFRIWRIEDTHYVADVIKKNKWLDLKKLYKNPTKLFFGMKNLTKKTFEYFDIKQYPPSEYFTLLQAAVSMPYASPGSYKQNGYRYKDFRKYAPRDHVDYVLKQGVTDLLVLYNHKNQIKYPAIFEHDVYEIVPPRSWKIERISANPSDLKKEFQFMRELAKNIFLGKHEKIKDIF
jgi:predicted patatin/cPLA2 family phospholipase